MTISKRQLDQKIMRVCISNKHPYPIKFLNHTLPFIICKLCFQANMQVTSCNTRFIKGHKPSNHIRARIKSHVYTTEWIVYHVKRYNKENTNVIYYINDKMSDTNMRKRRTSTKLSLKPGATGTSTGRRPPRSPHTPASSGWTPSRRQELSSSRASPKRTRGKE